MSEEAKQPDRARIMIVDDEAGVISSFVEFLSNCGFDAVGYTVAEEALQVIERETPDLILLDIMMPQVDGYEFCRLMKQNPATTDIPVVFVSGKDREDDAMLSAREGGTLFVSKPVPFDELREVVQLALRNQM